MMMITVVEIHISTTDNYILITDTPKKKNLTSSDLSKTQIVNGQRHLLERECAPSGLVSDFHSAGVLKTPVSTK
jgi:hypothetical protein